jgi:hypothetical protein
MNEKLKQRLDALIMASKETAIRFNENRPIGVQNCARRCLNGQKMPTGNLAVKNAGCQITR